MKTEFSSARSFLDTLTAGEDAPHLLVALSGGEDSMCLTHFVRAWCMERGANLTAAHLNHGLRGAAATRDENFVRENCAAWDIPLVVELTDVGAYAAREGKSIEEAGREARYAFLQRTAKELGCQWILTAHHANDNAETVLLNLLRGTGSRGLAGIPAVRDNIARPLLGVTRAEISVYAARHGIAHVTDECNLDPEEATRNLLRQKVLPLLVDVNPRAVENINRAAGIVGRENDTLDMLAEELLARGEECGDGFSISCDALREAPAALAERAVLLLLGRVGGARRDLGAAHVDAALRLAAGHGRAQLNLPYGVEVSRRDGKLYFLRAAQEVLAELPLRLGETVLFGDYELCAAEGCGGDIILRAEDAEKFTVGPWRSGEGMNLTQGRGKRSLKRLFAERGIEPKLRDTLPVIRCGGSVAAVWGIGIDLKFTPVQGEKSIAITIKNIKK